MLKNFNIDPKFFCDIQTKRTYSLLDDPKNPTPDDLIKILKNQHEMIINGTADHPKFAELRNMLEEQGYIRIQKSSWNGDTVLKPFTINQKLKFEVGNQFLCAAALGIHWQVKFKETVVFDR